MITLNDIESIIVGSHSSDTLPCMHKSIITLKDGRKNPIIGGYAIHLLISNIANEKILSESNQNPNEIKEHFRCSDVASSFGWTPESPEIVLNRNFHKLTLDDIERIEINQSCGDSYPCYHANNLILKDGRKAVLDSVKIHIIVSNIAKEKIFPITRDTNSKGGGVVIKHFSQYSKETTASPEGLLQYCFSLKYM